jgi:hypothetical protein
VTFLERIRRFWSSAAQPDHPLNAEARDKERRASAFDEKARVLESAAADDFDPDDPTARH